MIKSNGHIVKSNKLLSSTYVEPEIPLDKTDFNDIAAVADYVALNNKKVVFIVRHAERPSDAWNQHDPLTDNGFNQALVVGAKLTKLTKNNCYYGATTFVRTVETAYNIALGHGDTNFNSFDKVYSIDSFKCNMSSQYSSFKAYQDLGKTSLESGTALDKLEQYYLYGGQSNNPAYCKPGGYLYETCRSNYESLRADFANLIKDKQFAVLCSHDYYVGPLIMIGTDYNLTMDAGYNYAGSWNESIKTGWPNFVSGLAIIYDKNGNYETEYAIRGLDSGHR